MSELRDNVRAKAARVLNAAGKIDPPSLMNAHINLEQTFMRSYGAGDHCSPGYIWRHATSGLSAAGSHIGRERLATAHGHRHG
jgi:hypothetical protein